jgi:hypothetical protein
MMRRLVEGEILDVGYVVSIWIRRPLAVGRRPPTTDVGYTVAQLGGQVSGDETARPTGAGDPQPPSTGSVERLGTGHSIAQARPRRRPR